MTRAPRCLVLYGLQVEDTDPEDPSIATTSTRLPVDFCLVGDGAFTRAMLGHQGAASSYPILQDETPSSHLRKAHRDGSSHLPTNKGCQFPRRTMESIHSNYTANQLDKRNHGDMRKNGKFHMSITEQPLIYLKSITDVMVASLHFTLSSTTMATEYATLGARIQDGTATTKELARLATAIEAVQSEEEEGGE